VYVSQAPASVNIRNEVARKVAAGQFTDDEIVGYIESTFGGRVLLVPRATGFDALVWVLPVVVFVCAVSGLAVAFRRWRKQDSGDATLADITLVNELLRQHSTGNHGEDALDEI
jgi:cytochrome c-type biogenesis protein CcmH